jgi:hypothetical protein
LVTLCNTINGVTAQDTVAREVASLALSRFSDISPPYTSFRLNGDMELYR